MGSIVSFISAVLRCRFSDASVSLVKVHCTRISGYFSGTRGLVSLTQAMVKNDVPEKEAVSLCRSAHTSLANVMESLRKLLDCAVSAEVVSLREACAQLATAVAAPPPPKLSKPLGSLLPDFGDELKMRIKVASSNEERVVTAGGSWTVGEFAKRLEDEFSFPREIELRGMLLDTNTREAVLLHSNVLLRDLKEPVMIRWSEAAATKRIHEVAQVECTIWTKGQFFESFFS